MKKILMFLSCVLVLSGCASRANFHTYVDSISAPDSPNKKTYILLPGNEGTNSNDLQFIEYASYLVRSLSNSGYELANGYDSADLVVFLSYGIGEPHTEQYTYSVPTWGQTGVSSSSTYGTLNTFGNTSTYTGTTYYTPTYGITGSTTHVGSKTTYFRYLKVMAYDVEAYSQTSELKQVWATTVTSQGTSGDLREVMPILVSAADPYFGKNTGKKVSVSLRENDEVVQKIKGSLTNQQQ
ncbi:membrane lipoprotein lipid attachment site-containing protein [Vibrio fluvialis]|uniref:membrane lipoprotein lipid attachment site-containing protein n=1 Tax=Vibrio fluvialis TaxID=676 RepID=UPI001EECC0BA|nr:membrane lipoprotein lipid attachment site-containing protein [Vibrio fluvialis]MCG6399744.1 membrane lipoprotein lipid attachment site-containing protein [Vibrio fluvialis]